MVVPLIRRLSVLAALAAFVTACGGSTPNSGATPPAPASPSHIHGLGVDPDDGSVLVATHSGLLTAAANDERLRRVGRAVDVMGLTVVTGRTFLASGHGTGAGPRSGLNVSNDGGRTWRPVALANQVDLHVIRTGKSHTYAFDALSGKLLVSPNAGRNWAVGEPPGPLLDLAIDPSSDRRLIASTDDGLYRSDNRGADWTRIRRAGGWLAWTHGSRGILMATPDGSVRRSADKGSTWRRLAGRLPGSPVAFSGHKADAYAVVANGTVMRSTDGGRIWRVRARPAAPGGD